jgi:alpha-beta hydrolase superfamily lysophospholipase
MALCLVAVMRGCASRAKAKRWYELGRMGDEVLDQVLLFYLGESWAGMTDVGEVLETASRINAKDPRSWAREWRRTAERVEAQAVAAEAASHRFSSGELSLRAASYYRAALHRYMDPYAGEVMELAGKEVDAFTKAMKLLGLPVERVGVPYEGTTLAAYWYHLDDSRRHPAVIIHQGRDAWAEDNFYLGREALRRGYDCLIVDGPGQGSTLRLQGLTFRPDWEKVIGPAVDWLVARPDVDPEAVGLVGMSMGGALAPRAAEFEPRIAFLVANPGVSNWSLTFDRALDKINPAIRKMAASHPAALDALMTTAGKLSPFLRWGLTDTMWKHGVKKPSALMVDMGRYDASADLGRIACPTLVIDGEAEEYGDAKVLYGALSCPKTYMLFTKSEAAPLHVQTAALALGSQRVFDWIDETIALASGNPV